MKQFRLKKKKKLVIVARMTALSARLGDDVTLTLGPALQGLPECSRCGSVLAVFDARAGATGPRELTGLYRRRVPLGLPLTLKRAREDSAETFVLCDQSDG